MIRSKRIAVFGLGDVTYDRFNKFAKDVFGVFERRKAAIVSKIGFGSDHEDEVAQYFHKWKGRCVRDFSKIDLPDFAGNIKDFLAQKIDTPKLALFVASKVRILFSLRIDINIFFTSLYRIQ